MDFIKTIIFSVDFSAFVGKSFTIPDCGFKQSYREYRVWEWVVPGWYILKNTERVVSGLHT